MADGVVQSCRQALSRPDRLIRTVLVNGHKGSAGAYTGLCAMPNGSSILRLIDAVLKETQRQARGTEARRLIQHAIQRVAAISAAQGLLHDPDERVRLGTVARERARRHFDRATTSRRILEIYRELAYSM